MNRRSRAWSALRLVLALALAASALPSIALAQPVVVEPRGRGRGGGGAVVTTPPPRGGGGGAVVTTPPRGGGGGAVVVQPPRGGAVVATPPPRGGTVVVEPPRGGVVVEPPRGGAVVAQPPPRGGVVVEPPRGGAVVVQPPPRGGAVVVEPPRRGGTVVVTPPQPPRGGVVVQPPPRGGVVVQPPPRGGGVVVATPRVVVRRPPPRVRVTMPPPPPRPRVWVAPAQPGEVWLDGFWHWDGGQWLWVDGHWELPPEPGAIWVSPEVAGGQWVPGYWTMPSFPGGAGTMGRPYQVGAYISGFLTYSDPVDPRTGGRYHDYLVSLSAGQSATFFAVAGPSERMPGQRVPLFLEVLWNGQPMASADVSTSPFDARVVFTAPRPAVYTLRVHTRGGVDTGTYVLESAAGSWMPEVDPYQQFWGQPQPQPQPQWGQPQPTWVAPPGAAVAVQVGQTIDGRLEPGDYVDETGGMYDEFVLEQRPGETFTVIARCGTTLSGQSVNDVVLRVYANGQLYAEDDDSGGGRNARVLLSAPMGVPVVIRVATWRGSMERDGSYSISILPGHQPGAQ